MTNLSKKYLNTN
ncbi:hypothetical protein G9C98_004092 [Cotesia typhae]|uniref:Uncharacterized protein n=1 Tax=Cotesia typhae TaxID=2053667 RepID=A0A8J5QNB1_9HYME|nr:hypothetical protein G9C98_004092 [Cotesia typhae]